ncbi:MAG: hypothetical protein KAS72_09190 [Phycisphaerales bacterium]|nr:hypothetical protein [Phycisphaerales bacterium]
MLTRTQISTAVCLVALAGAAVSAEVYDPDTRSGEIFSSTDSVVVFGLDQPITVRYWVPLLLDEASSALNNALVRIIDGRVLGGVSSFSSAGNPNLIWYLGTADQLDANGGYTSNNVQIDEYPEYRTNTLGQMLSDGTLVYRANYAGTAQNNIEAVLSDVFSQQPPYPEPGVGDEILDGPGTSGEAGSVYLGNPAAIESIEGAGYWVGVSCYDAGSGNVPVGVNLWLYNGIARPAVTADYTYTQAAAEAFAISHGVTIDPPGEGRQTQPVLANVEGVLYCVHGINDTTEGGGGRPAIMAIDAFEDNDSYTGAVAILPPLNSRFIDHQATGGGTSPFEGKHFDMNSTGQFVVVAETIQSVPTYSLLLYNPIMSAGRISAFASPITIADAGPLSVIDEGLGGPIILPDDIINAISGVGINEAGNIAFTATYDTGEVDEYGDPILSSAAYFYDAGTGLIHQVLREGDLVGQVGNQISVGLLPQEGSDSFYGPSLADEADVIAFNFRPDNEPTGGVRGSIVIAMDHMGDADFDGDVDQSDLGILLAAYNSTFGTPMYDPQADFDADGDIDQSDLGILLANYGL